LHLSRRFTLKQHADIGLHWHVGSNGRVEIRGIRGLVLRSLTDAVMSTRTAYLWDGRLRFSESGLPERLNLCGEQVGDALRGREDGLLDRRSLDSRLREHAAVARDGATPVGDRSRRANTRPLPDVLELAPEPQRTGRQVRPPWFEETRLSLQRRYGI
jgi:hypothetical protein